MGKVEMICENDNLKENAIKLEKMGYKYIVKANDTWLGGSFNPWGKKHIHLIACRTIEERNIIMKDLQNDKCMNYITWNYIDNYKALYGYTRGKTFSIRNDWVRAFEQGGENV